VEGLAANGAAVRFFGPFSETSVVQYVAAHLNLSNIIVVFVYLVGGRNLAAGCDECTDCTGFGRFHSFWLLLMLVRVLVLVVVVLVLLGSCY
jgi:hypothetical protein